MIFFTNRAALPYRQFLRKQQRCVIATKSLSKVHHNEHLRLPPHRRISTVKRYYVTSFIIPPSSARRSLRGLETTSLRNCIPTTQTRPNLWNDCNHHHHPIIAPFSTTALKGSSSSSNLAFDRQQKLLQRDGAARSHRAIAAQMSNNNNNNNDADISSDDYDTVDYDYFQDEIAMRLVDRLDDIKRDDGFSLALEIGSGAGHLHRAICSDEGLNGVGGIGGVRKLVQLDSSEGMLHRDDDLEFPGRERCGTYKLVADEEAALPFPDGTFDLVISSASLHRVNRLPHVLAEAKRVLKDDGCLMFAMVGASTLPELRSSLVLAEMERDGGVSPHVGPFVDVTDVGSLLTNAGFTLPTVDIDTITIGYPNAMVLMEHLQRMGEGNACLNKRNRVGRDMFVAAAAIYQEIFGLEGEEESVQASVQVIYGIGWTPHESQQTPAERGSATHKVGGMVEHHKK